LKEGKKSSRNQKKKLSKRRGEQKKEADRWRAPTGRLHLRVSGTRPIGTSVKQIQKVVTTDNSEGLPKKRESKLGGINSVSGWKARGNASTPMKVARPTIRISSKSS